MKHKQIDFLFVLHRPEFFDFVKPIFDTLESAGCRCLTLKSNEINDFKIRLQKRDLSEPSVVLSTNEFQEISLFENSKKVLLPHSIFIRDSTPTPDSLGFRFFSEFDFYFAPNVFWFEWIIKSLIDVSYYDHLNQKKKPKFIIPGGYLKKLPSTSSEFQQINNESPLILYAPSVFSPELKEHRFHIDGSKILISLAKSFPQARLICRPHPTDSHQKYIQHALSSLAEYRNVSFDFSLTPNAKLYSEPDIVITDMSGFAFTHEFVTTLKPIFMFNKFSTETKRFAQLASTFGDIATSVEELIMLVARKLASADYLEKSEVEVFRNLFLGKVNSPNQLLIDLMSIKNSSPSVTWLEVPFLFDTLRHHH